MILRVDFIGFSVMGPSLRSKQAYKPDGADGWPGWSVAVEGPHVVFEGEGRHIEVPRAACVVTSQLKPKVAKESPADETKGKAK